MLSYVLLHLAYLRNKNVMILALMIQKMPKEYLEIFTKLILIRIYSIFEYLIDMHPDLLSHPPQPIDDLLVPVCLGTLAELIPETVVILHCSLVILIIAEHVSGEVFVFLF